MLNIKRSLPFLLTAIIALAGWICSFIGVIMYGAAGFHWWIVIFHLILIIGVFAYALVSSVRGFRYSFLPWIAIGLVLLTIGTDETVYSHVSKVKLIAAGYIIMGIHLAIWAFGFGSDHGSKVHRWFHPDAYEAIPEQTASSRPEAPPAMTQTAPTHPAGQYPILPVNPEYKYRVRASHPYTASREDPNEMSFSKGDVLEVVDTNGKWWHARKPDGTIGIIPSNYVEVIN
ncbi:Transmembrane osmosensor [Basidiobolus ranarum]|uniref:Transmembrane osmosensor n=1 Tax=Basidiobolus ranarum TaxID=34480 RepID=A0ABR2VYE0_9FUNG